MARSDGAYQAEATVSTSAIEGHDSTFESVIDKLVVVGELDGTWQASDPPKVTFELRAASGELLWRRLYADLQQHPVKVSGSARAGHDGLKVNGLKAQVGGIGTISADLGMRPFGSLKRLDAEIEVPDLQSLFDLAVREPLRESYAFLEQTSVQGRLSAAASYRYEESGASLAGDLHVTGAAFRVADPVIEGRDLAIELPLRLGALPAAAQQAGRVSMSGMTIGSLQLPATDATLQVSANRIQLASALVVPLLGGSLEVGELIVANLDSAERHASLGVVAHDVGLTALTEIMGWPSLNGTITGAIPKVTIDARQIRSEGVMRALVFGGDVTVTNLRVDQLFSSIPTLGFDMQFEEISLGQLTQTLEIGQVSGIARGAVQNLAITNGQAVSFDAWMETVPRDGVPQRISVDAIRQLSLLGGSGGDPLTQGVLSFFDEYRYARMGFRCRLENDKFVLHGVERSEGKDYLVVGSFLPPRVNVVSHNEIISFSEMVRRLQRVSTASTEEKGDRK
jgi:hypothetical protein